VNWNYESDPVPRDEMHGKDIEMMDKDLEGRY
jgi:hypothetical protein